MVTDLIDLISFNAPVHPSFSRSRTTIHQLAICITNKALLIFAELHELFVIKLLVDSYVVHLKNLPLNFLLLSGNSISLLHLYYHPMGPVCIVSSDDTTP